MQYCKECGSKIGHSTKFCKSCGAIITPKGQYDSVMDHSQASVKEPMSKKHKKLFILVGIAIILLFGAYKTGETLTSKDRLINNFEKALITKNSSKVAELLSSSDKKLIINKDSIQSLMKYLDKNPQLEKETISDLRQQSGYLNNTKGNDVNSFGNQMAKELFYNKLVNLKKDGKILFFDTYKLEIESVYLTLQTNYKNTDLYIDGKNIGKSSKLDFKKTYGPFVPGIHTAEAKLKTTYVDLKTKDDIILTTGDETKDLYLDGRDLTVNLPNNGPENGTAKLFINGKDVGVDLYKNPTFGPILTDGTMKMYVESTLPWGQVKTDEVPIKKEEMNVNFVNSDLKNTIMETINKSIDEEMEAYTTADVSKFTTASENYKDDIKSSADYNKSDNYIYKGSHKYTKFDLDSIYLYNEDDKWVVTIDAEVGYFDDYFYNDEEPNLEDNSKSHTFELYYDKTINNWLVDNKYDSFGMNDTNVNEIKNDNPKEYVSAWYNSTTTNSTDQ